MNIFLDFLNSTLYSCGSIIIIIIGALLVIGIKLICNKIGFELNKNEYDVILGIVKQVVKYIDQTYTDTIKKHADTGELTEYQQNAIKEKAMIMLDDLLTTNQIQYLLKKYNMMELDEITDFLIESTIAEARKENSNSTIIIDNNKSNNDKLEIVEENVSGITQIYELTEEEKNSLMECNGKCNYCPLHKTCNISRISDI